MTDEQGVTKNILIGGEFDKYVLDHPEILDQIPEDAYVFIVPKNDPELYEENMRLARKCLEEGETVVYIDTDGLMPESGSRLINPRIRIEKMDLPCEGGDQ